jgi:hypothetical protein
MSLQPTEAARETRYQKIRTGLARLWRPNGLAEQVAQAWPGPGTGEAALVYWRVRLLTSAVFCILVALPVPFIIGVLAGQPTFSATMFFLMGTIAALNGAVLHGFRLWMLFKLGGWSRRGDGPVRRAEQPTRFWTWAAISSGIMAIWLAGAGFLIWTISSRQPF